MYDIRPNILLGFHGCDLETRNKLANFPNQLEFSKTPYEWLGHGMYFWENNYERALEWAETKKKAGKINNPAVIGAVIHLGNCCDFLDSKFITLIQQFYPLMVQHYKTVGKNLPTNLDAKNDPNRDKLLRILDCATIEFMHSMILDQRNEEISTKGWSDKVVFDSTRGVFTEGGPAFEGAGLFEKSHIQICVRNSNCIKGFFIPREEKRFP